MKASSSDYEVKQWSPRMIKVTLIANRNHGFPRPTTAYVNPLHIVFIGEVEGNYQIGTTNPPQFWPPVTCTEINLGTLGRLLVEESPEQIALMRNAALEIPQTLSTVHKTS